MPHFHRKLFSAVAIAATLALSLPALAADTATPTADQAPAKSAKNPVEAQITRLRKELHITDAQAPQFDAVAQVMRENRDSHDALVKEKKKDGANLNAVQDLQAYADIAQNHADGVKKMATAFETLYGVLSDDQKKAADQAFREHKKRVMQQMKKSQ